jgi:hypothetical protein
MCPGCFHSRAACIEPWRARARSNLDVFNRQASQTVFPVGHAIDTAPVHQ